MGVFMISCLLYYVCVYVCMGVFMLLWAFFRYCRHVYIYSLVGVFLVLGACLWHYGRVSGIGGVIMVLWMCSCIGGVFMAL